MSRKPRYTPAELRMYPPHTVIRITWRDGEVDLVTGAQIRQHQRCFERAAPYIDRMELMEGDNDMTCEKCWRDSMGNADQYLYLVRTRPECTPEQQAGPDADECPVCHRRTMHQHCHRCTNPDCDATKGKTI